MKTLRTFLLLLLFLVPVTVFAGCQTDPITGERTFNIYSIEDDIRIGQEAMVEFLELSEKNNWMPDDAESMAMQRKCDQIMNRIIPYTHLPDLPWKIYYTKNPTPNAFALPGGQMMIFQGIMKKYNPKDGLLEDEEELAAVIAHEMAHVNARHGTENVSKAIVAQIALVAAAAGSAAGGGGGDAVNAMNQMINVLFPKFSRTAEEEADTVGTLYMAMGGFNPEAAVRVWERGAEERPRAASIYDTHPTNATRAEYLKNLMPQAKKVYAEAQAGKDFRLPENRVELFGATQPVVVKTNAGVPATASENFAYEPGKVDVANHWKDEKNQVLMIRVKNNTDKDIEDFVLKVTFKDVRGNIVGVRPIKIKKDLDKGKYIDVAVPIPAGAHKVDWNLENIKWD